MPSVAIVAIKAVPAKMPAVELLLPVWGKAAFELESLSAFDNLTVVPAFVEVVLPAFWLEEVDLLALFLVLPVATCLLVLATVEDS